MHRANGIKIIISISNVTHGVLNPKDRKVHFEYDRFFISSRNGSMSYTTNVKGSVRLNQKKGQETSSTSLLRQNVSRDICRGGSQIGKFDFQPLELWELLRQHVQQIRAQDLNSYGQAL